MGVIDRPLTLDPWTLSTDPLGVHGPGYEFKLLLRNIGGTNAPWHPIWLPCRNILINQAGKSNRMRNL
jgi:hypothetical protein